VEFDKEINTIMIITKKGYNLNSTVNFLNKSVTELQKKRLEDKNFNIRIPMLFKGKSG
jgi:allophanate hydrolase subunit 1